MPQKSRYTAVAPPVIGQNAKSLDDLMESIKEEYVYNTKVRIPAPNYMLTRKNLLRTARKASMRAAKRQLDACGHAPVTIKVSEPETGHFVRFGIEVRVAIRRNVNYRCTMEMGQFPIEKLCRDKLF